MARVLIVDDDEILAELLAEHLDDAGHSVSIVHDGGEALGAVERDPPDLLILDYELPGRSGLDILRDIRRRPSLEDMPVLMLTAKTETDILASAHQDGADEYLTKPVAPVILVARVGALLVGGKLVRRARASHGSD